MVLRRPYSANLGDYNVTALTDYRIADFLKCSNYPPVVFTRYGWHDLLHRIRRWAYYRFRCGQSSGHQLLVITDDLIVGIAL